MLNYWEFNNLIRPFAGRRHPVNLNAPWRARPVRVIRPVPIRPPPNWIPDTDDEDFAQRIETEIREHRLAEEHEEAILVAESRYDDYIRTDMAPYAPRCLADWTPDTEDEDLEERIYSEQREAYIQAELEARTAAMDLADEIAVGMAFLDPGNCVVYLSGFFHIIPHIDSLHLFTVAQNAERLQVPGSQAAQRRVAEVLHSYRDVDVGYIMSQSTPLPRGRRSSRSGAAERRVARMLLNYQTSDDGEKNITPPAARPCPCECHRRPKRKRESPTSGYESHPSPDQSLNSTTPSDDAYDEARSALLYGDDSINGGRYAENYTDAPDAEVMTAYDGSDVDWASSILRCPETMDPPSVGEMPVKQEYILPDSSGFESDTGSVEIIAVVPRRMVKARRIQHVDLC